MIDWGRFTSSSGDPLDWKIECDDLTDDDIKSIAALYVQRAIPFDEVIGVPTGGLRLEAALKPYRTQGTGTLLIVDDVLTTGRSMNELSQKHRAPFKTGFVIFARGPCPAWITPLFFVAPKFR